MAIHVLGCSNALDGEGADDESSALSEDQGDEVSFQRDDQRVSLTARVERPSNEAAAPLRFSLKPAAGGDLTQTAAPALVFDDGKGCRLAMTRSADKLFVYQDFDPNGPEARNPACGAYVMGSYRVANQRANAGGATTDWVGRYDFHDDRRLSGVLITREGADLKVMIDAIPKTRFLSVVSGTLTEGFFFAAAASGNQQGCALAFKGDLERGFGVAQYLAAGNCGVTERLEGEYRARLAP